MPHYRFSHIVAAMKEKYNIRIRKWRRSMSGCAWRVYCGDGSEINWIECPHPKTPISLAIFLHEVGHHVIGFTKFKKRCEEEYHAWVWALNTMESCGVALDSRVFNRFKLSMEYAVRKAIRRHIKHLPPILEKFIPDDLLPQAA